MAKHLVDLDEEALRVAQAELGTVTIKGTVNAALHRAASARKRKIKEALDGLAQIEMADRSTAWH